MLGGLQPTVGFHTLESSVTDSSHSSISFSSMPISSRSSLSDCTQSSSVHCGVRGAFREVGYSVPASMPSLVGLGGALNFPLVSSLVGIFGLAVFPAFVAWGEALNPGPLFAINLANPTGVRGKEKLLYDLPRGITCVAETHLASPSMSASCSAFRHFARQDNRSLRLLPGAAVPLRPRSSVTGVWSGVMQLSDLPCHRLQLHWPQDEFKLGRVQTASFRYGDLSIFGAIIYGWSPGPTRPKALQATRGLLRHLTQEVIHGPVAFASFVGTLMEIILSFLSWMIGFMPVGWKSKISSSRFLVRDLTLHVRAPHDLTGSSFPLSLLHILFVVRSKTCFRITVLSLVTLMSLRLLPLTLGGLCLPKFLGAL